MAKTFIKSLIHLLNQSQIKYVLTGGFALPYYGFPRASLDIDIIVEKNKTKLLKLASKLREEGFDVSDEDIIYAVENCEHFAVFYKNEFPYFDFKIACDGDSRFALSSYKLVKYHNIECRLVSPEALIIKKIEWEDFRDVKTILIRYKEKLDMEKLITLAKTKNLSEKLQQMLNELE